MKKYLYSALALPLLFACSSDDLIEKEMISNDQFAGIEKVDATFIMDDMRASTRMDAGSWNPQEGDLWGFAWLGDGLVIDPSLDGRAYQNHNLIQTTDEGGTTFFKPQTSIYVGSYFIYRPYDFTTVSPQAINFKSLEKQTISEGYASSTQAWRDLAKTAINIGDKWTVVTKDGTPDASDPKKFWDKAGIEQNFKLYAAMFSNQTGLDMKYTKNDVAFDGTKAIAGATDIKFTPAAGTKVGAADIYSGTVALEDADNSFTYAPTKAPMATAGNTDHVTGFWADKSNLVASGYTGFTFAKGAIALNAVTEKAKDGISTEGKTTGWIWFNSLPVEDATGAAGSTVNTELTTSYGVVTIPSTVGDCAYEFHDFGTATAHNYQWVKLAAATDETKSPKEWDVTTKSTFVNQYGNHKGKFAITVDFSKGVMDGMHIINDNHLQKALKYYIASGKDEAGATLLLDKDADNEFKISKLSIALLQTINAGGIKVLVKACDDATHTPDRIVITQEGQTGDLAGKTEVPALNNVFAAATDVILAKNTNWTWTEGAAADGKIPEGKLTIDANVTKITNEGTLTVNATNVQLSEADVKIINAKGATMNITKVTTVKNTLHNYGTLNVGSASNKTAELRAYGPKWIVNNATSLTEHGVINNYGVVGVTAGTSGQFNNYGLINMMNNDAITLLTSNEKGATPFKNTFDSSTNKMGTVVLPTGNPYAIVSVSNAAENGFIKYNWTEATYTHDPGNVKYNTLVVSGNIEFTGDVAATEIQFIEFDGTNRALVVNPAGAASKLTELKGIIVKDNSSIVIEKTNEINCKVGAFLGEGATVYKGGAFTVAGAAFATPTNTTMYLGTWSLDQIVEY